MTDEYDRADAFASMNRPGRVGQVLHDHRRAAVASGVHRYDGLQPDWTGATDTSWAALRRQAGRVLERLTGWLPVRRRGNGTDE